MARFNVHAQGATTPFLYAGTLVTAGGGVARVQATGHRTEIGRIGQALQGSSVAETPLQRESRLLVARLGWAAGALSLVAAVAYAMASHRLLDGILAGLTLAMAIIPNEFPVVVTMFLALGAWRLSRRRVLVRRVPAVELLGAATVLCVDKTGTLTENRMSVSAIHANGETFPLQRLRAAPLPESMHAAVEYGILASRSDPFDPMGRAFKQLGEGELSGTEHLHPDWELVREHPLTRKRWPPSSRSGELLDEARSSRQPRAHRRPSPGCAVSAPRNRGAWCRAWWRSPRADFASS